LANGLSLDIKLKGQNDAVVGLDFSFSLPEKSVEQPDCSGRSFYSAAGDRKRLASIRKK
jgi:hypothetical protein